MNQEERKTAVRRMRVLVAAACILMLLYGLRLIFLQLVNGDDFKSQATNTTDYKFTVTAARGDIESALPPASRATTWCSTSC